MGSILLRWCYTSGNWYEFLSDSSAQVGQLYRLKVLENDVIKVEVVKDQIVVIEWSKEHD
jgi:hypothetical protein